MSAPWPLPMLFTSWGFRTKGDKWSTPDELADYAAAAGCPSVAVQLGHEPTTNEPNCYSGEAQRLRERGLRVLVWGVAGTDYVRQELERLHALPTDWLPQVENDPERDLVLDQARAGIRPQGIVSNYGGASTPSDVDALRQAGVQAVLVEIYTAGGITDVDLMLWQGTMYGWEPAELFACFGTYKGELPDDYSDTQGIGRTWGLYLAEPMSSEQFHLWGEFDAGPPPGPKPEPPTPEEGDMEPVSDQQARDAGVFAYLAAAQNWDEDKPRGRLTLAARILQADNDDSKWNKARDKVKAALDDAAIPDVWDT